MLPLIFTDYYRRVQGILRDDAGCARWPTDLAGRSMSAPTLLPSRCARSSATWWPMRPGLSFGGPAHREPDGPYSLSHGECLERGDPLTRTSGSTGHCEDRALRIGNLRVSRPVGVRGGQHSRTEVFSGCCGVVAVGDRERHRQRGCVPSCAVTSQLKASAKPGGTESPDCLSWIPGLTSRPGDRQTPVAGLRSRRGRRIPSRTREYRRQPRLPDRLYAGQWKFHAPGCWPFAPAAFRPATNGTVRRQCPRRTQFGRPRRRSKVACDSASCCFYAGNGLVDVQDGDVGVPGRGGAAEPFVTDG